MKDSPLVSVVMPVYNAGSFLEEAIESILSQTYKNFEFVIVNDASCDGTSKILSFYKSKEKRIKVISTKTNLGVVRSASLGVFHTRGQFVARMDADDIATPTRIGKQVKFLLAHKDVVAVGGQCELIDRDGVGIGKKRFPTEDKQIRNMIFSNVPLQQPTLMVNTNLLPAGFVWYDENYSSAEELELLFKLFKFGKVRNLKDTVLKYRMHNHNTSLINPKKTFYLTLKTRLIAILKYGYIPTFKGVITTLLQTVFVGLMPNSWIYPVYAYVRGIRRFSLKSVRISLDANSVKTQKIHDFYKKTYQSAKA